MTPQELAQFIQYIKSANIGQIQALLNILGYPLSEPMDSAVSEHICRTLKKKSK